MTVPSGGKKMGENRRVAEVSIDPICSLPMSGMFSREEVGCSHETTDKLVPRGGVYL